MAIKERGVKRTCQACGGVFYDMLNDPIICPKCGAGYDPEAILKDNEGINVIRKLIGGKNGHSKLNICKKLFLPPYYHLYFAI